MIYKNPTLPITPAKTRWKKKHLKNPNPLNLHKYNYQTFVYIWKLENQIMLLYFILLPPVLMLLYLIIYFINGSHITSSNKTPNTLKVYSNWLCVIKIAGTPVHYPNHWLPLFNKRIFLYYIIDSKFSRSATALRT